MVKLEMPSNPVPVLMTQRILWFAMLVSCFLYMIIAFVVLKKPPVETLNPMMPLVFGIVSVSVAGASFIVPRIVYQNAAKAADVAIEEDVAPNAFPDRYRDAMAKRSVFANPKDAANKAFALFMSPFILSLALSETVALFGFVLAQLGFAPTVSTPFFLAGATLIAIRFPKQTEILGMFEKARGAVFPSQSA